jgi:CDP-glycerol glycerophosphotransferase (TagB/SpsB family)
MRKHQQQQILGLIQTLREAQKAGLYADCQDGALGCVDFIDDIMGEGTKTVEFLKEYCELLFKVHNGEADKDILRKSLRQIESSVQNELKPTKIEMVFFPYKASMWDSFESIYLAAKEDPDCNAIVVPIPYYDRNPDGSFGKMHYEGDLYPDYIEVTDWREYDAELRRPEAVFVHNPYDGNNFVTSVHPDYYCERLRNFTDCLVYVPYFVVSGDIIQEHFATARGCVYAHKVVVQSEKLCDSYINEYKKVYGDKFGKAEDKFLALGSPKFDAVINKTRDDFKLPNEWTELIGDRKVVLYNTSVGAILQGGEQYLKKLRSVIEAFHGQDGVVLWWRPHPLSMSTYESMRPGLVTEYRSIVEEYKSAGFGIYDDSADLNRAIAWSDAYYGDASSLVAMYGVTGKPILLQDICELATSRDGKFVPAITDFVVKDGVMWFIAMNINGIFTMNMETYEVRLEALVPRESAFGCFIFYNIEIYGNYVILTPFYGKNIVRYNMSDGTFDTHSLENPEKYNFHASYRINGKIYMFPHLYPAVVEYDTESGNIISDNETCVALKNSNGKWFSRYGTVCDDVITVACGNSIVKYEINTKKGSFQQIGNSENIYWGIEKFGDWYWLIPYKGNIVKWNEKTGNIKEISSYPIGFRHTRQGLSALYNFVSSVVFEKSIYLIPALSNMLLKINTETDKIEVVINLDERAKQHNFSLNFIYGNYSCAKRIGDYIYAFSYCENSLQKINPHTAETENISITLSEEDCDLFADKPLFDQMSLQMHENTVVNLPFFLDKLAKETINQEQIHAINLCGEKIYEYVKFGVK